MSFSQFVTASPSDKCSHLSELIYVWLKHFLAKTTTAVFSLLIITLGCSHTKYHTSNKKELLTTMIPFVLDKAESTAVLPCRVVKTSLISDQRFHDTGELTLCHGSKVWLICLSAVQLTHLPHRLVEIRHVSTTSLHGNLSLVCKVWPFFTPNSEYLCKALYSSAPYSRYGLFVTSGGCFSRLTRLLKTSRF